MDRVEKLPSIAANKNENSQYLFQNPTEIKNQHFHEAPKTIISRPPSIILENEKGATSVLGMIVSCEGVELNFVGII